MLKTYPKMLELPWNQALDAVDVLNVKVENVSIRVLVLMDELKAYILRWIMWIYDIRCYTTI